jgi:rSAM/selenodomain-associated transferase 1
MQQIAVFARAPEPGQAKTRLIPLLGADGAARLQAALIDAAVAKAAAVAGAQVTLWTAGDAAHPHWQAVVARHRVALRAQEGADLGARMHAAFVATLTPGAEPCVLIGTDCPALTATHLAQAFEALAAHDAVFVPALDGGYVLIGLRSPQPTLFESIPWGSTEVMQATRLRAQAARLRMHELPPLPDLDTPADYRHALAQGWIAPV